MMSADPNHQPHTLEGEIPAWILVVMVILFILILEGHQAASQLAKLPI